MDWWWLIVLVPWGGWYLWRRSKDEEKARVAKQRLSKDKRLHQNIEAGMREYRWREREKPFSWKAKHRELLFETAHLQAFHLNNPAEFRVGFYFKDLDAYGIYGVFAGNGDETITSYYRSDSAFTTETMLAPWYDEDEA